MVGSLEEVTTAERALIVGIGGGGDVVSTIPTARLLELFGVDIVLGGVIWVPVPRDDRPGPRSLDELEQVEPVQERIARVSSDSTTVDGISLAEAKVAKLTGDEVLALDITGGVNPLSRSLDAYCQDTGTDLVIGVDAGGDALAVGDEPGLRSPLTDAIGLAVLADLDCDSLLGVIGFGSDGELTQSELTEAVGTLAAAGALLGAWGITPRIKTELERILSEVETEASRLPVEAAAGRFGEQRIRDGRRRATVTPMAPITYYFDPSQVANRSKVTELVRGATDVADAADRLSEHGLITEFDLERDRLESG